MSDFTTPARHTAGQSPFGVPQQSTQGLHTTMSGAGPVRPEDGSPLALLLSRQPGLAGPSRLLGFVPAQVR
jgi:hypothetical protein